MKKILCFFICIAVCMIAGCEKNTGENSEMIIPEGYSLVKTGEENRDAFEGASVEFDPHFFSQNVTKGNVKAEDWQIVESRVKKMKIDRFRVMLLPSWLEPFNDNDDSDNINWDNMTTESAEMKSLYKVLDLAQANNINVNITLWGAQKQVSLVDLDMNTAVNAQGKYFLSQGNEGSNWVIGTLKVDEFAENFAAYVKLLIVDKKYTCIKEITPINEPDWSYQINNSALGNFEEYAKLCKAIDAKFKKYNLRNLVKFNLSDNTDTRVSWLESTALNLDDIADIYNSHTYIFGYDSPNSAIKNWEIANENVVRSTGKPHIIGEFGSNQSTGSTRQSDIDSYERGVLMVRQFLNFLNAGAAGASYWVLFDEYYGYKESYAQMMQLGLWRSAKEEYSADINYYNKIKCDYEVRPQYYAYGLISKFTDIGDKIYPLVIDGEEFTVGTAFKKANGKWVYILANGSGKSKKLSLNNGTIYGDFNSYVYKKESLPETDDMITTGGILSFKNQVLNVELDSQTVTVLEQS